MKEFFVVGEGGKIFATMETPVFSTAVNGSLWLYTWGQCKSRAWDEGGYNGKGREGTLELKATNSQ